MGSSACSCRRVLASESLICAGGTSGTWVLAGHLLVLRTIVSANVGNSGQISSNREGQQVRCKSLIAIGLEKNKTLPEGDAGEI